MKNEDMRYGAWSSTEEYNSELNIKSIHYMRWGYRTIMCMITLEDGHEFIGSVFWHYGNDLSEVEAIAAKRIAKHKAMRLAHEYIL